MKIIYVIFNKETSRCSGYAMYEYSSSSEITISMSEEEIIDMLGGEWQEATERLMYTGEKVIVTDLPIDEDGIDPRDEIDPIDEEGIEPLDDTEENELEG